MHSRSALSVAPVQPATEAQVLALEVLPNQRAFVGRIDDLLADAGNRASCEPMAILLDTRVIGFYCIETCARVVAPVEFDAPALGLRGFFLDAQWQGQGLARPALAAVIDDVAKRHPAAKLLVLAVGAGNTAALALYLGAGFRDSGGRYHGGPAGLQHLLTRRLNN
ncbi:GNAT family N-acetyltransferase [Dyella sp.]|uniref:GNAT family N-acetyltransferase n=1 Tax=Dyella sp. TaxID=1869338 RepID=UPI002D77B243|nr:GNAT family N-acetyltransferase [Dyella sp.]HET6433765.1 GNAT family N-acetyltransferase [Dyella sp.]